MPPKQKTPAPIDRPLSRAYLREFTGWSNEFTPGLSDPSSLRIMENLEITSEGAAKIRPGMKPYRRVSEGYRFMEPLPATLAIISKFELFYDELGNELYLCALSSISVNGPAQHVTFGVFDPRQCSIEVMDESYFEGANDSAHRFSAATTRVTFLQLDNKIVALSNAGEDAIVFWVGETKKVERFREVHAGVGGVMMRVPRKAWVETGREDGESPFPVTPATGDRSSNLMTSVDPEDWYNILTFSTYAHEMGETNPSHVVQSRIARGLSNWDARPPDEESWIDLPDPKFARDQLVLGHDMSGNDTYVLRVMEVLKAGVNNGATHWNMYGAVWSRQDVAPVEAALVAEVDLRTPEVMAYVHGTSSAADARAAMSSLWGHWTIGSMDVTRTHLIPARGTGSQEEDSGDINFSTPTSASNGAVIGDRLVLVGDPQRPAEIWWSSNQPGRFINLTPSFGGGRKTLTSGNLQIPVSVLLWQNPQSNDTTTILTQAEDGQSRAYYMAPGQVASQSESTNIMSFEETTATEGTVSPWANQVLNNALYHPLDGGLVKSTASNYNISHRGMTDQISGSWTALRNKHVIDTCRLGNRLFFLVNNPHGYPCTPWLDYSPAEWSARSTGNEVWVLDTASEKGTWSRWRDTYGRHLQTMMVDGELRVCLIRPDCILFFDDNAYEDTHWWQYWSEYWQEYFWERYEQRIVWRLETNIQGANRAHDAWAHLQQVQVTLGNFAGTMRYGVRGRDLHGQEVEVSKIYRSRRPFPPRESPYYSDYFNLPEPEQWDDEDQLLIKRDMKEWVFFAGTDLAPLAPDGPEYDDADLGKSYGQINLLQYRYTPVSVNVGSAFGSVETFEYGHARDYWNAGHTLAGVPNNFNGGQSWQVVGNPQP